MLAPSASSPIKTQRRKTVPDSLERSALPIAMPMNALMSAMIAGPDEDHLWIATDTGMVLKLVTE